MLGAMAPDGFPSGFQPEQVRWSGLVKNEAVQIEITVVFGNDGVAVRFNFHRLTTDAVAAAAAAEEFPNDKKTARTLLKQILNQEVHE
jgi:hypothetical protein